MLYRQILRPALFRLAGGDPERIHERVIGGLGIISRSAALTQALSLVASLGGAIPPETHLEAFGLRFPHPVGLAAGFDKNAQAIPALAALGFGFVEIGTVTRDAQPGNPRPRLFRLPEDGALINRMGFNNEGAETVARRLSRVVPARVPIGVSLGKSRVTPVEDAVDDYLASLDTLYLYGDYFAVNISSPNTPGLRALQEGKRLDSLLQALTARLAVLAALDAPFRRRPKPLLVKIAPDLDAGALDKIIEICLTRGASGVIAVNTTTSRDGLGPASQAGGAEAGGLSGRPLQRQALAVIRYLHAQCGDRLPIIGCGGIFSAGDARRMLDAGAVLLQIYTGFIYEGPLVARRIVRALDLPVQQKGQRA